LHRDTPSSTLQQAQTLEEVPIRRTRFPKNRSGVSPDDIEGREEMNEGAGGDMATLATCDECVS